jgi:hypothetical protein
MTEPQNLRPTTTIPARRTAPERPTMRWVVTSTPAGASALRAQWSVRTASPAASPAAA